MQPNIIGSGTYANVFSDDDIAIKTIQHLNIESAIKEMGFIKACDHPNVIKIHKVRMDSTKTELYMKRYAYDLDKYMKKYGLIPIELIFSFARDLLDGIVHVHSKDIVHGDLKPQNILVDIIHRQLVPVICDFGTSIVCDDERHYGRLQTCTYRAPEIDYDRMKVLHSAKIDMWSIGCILFELASGRPAVNYVNGIEDSSWYTCNFFELYHDSRGERLKMLRKVDYKYIRKIIIKKLSHESVRAELLNKTGFVELIARCLHPNHNKRVDSKSALDYINHLINPSIGLTPNLKFSIFPSEVGIDEMDCVANVDQDIIAGCNSSGLCLADILYNRYIKICNNYDEQDVKYACIFIASCIFPGYYHVPTMIMCKLSPKKIHGIASHIMVKFRGRIL